MHGPVVAVGYLQGLRDHHPEVNGGGAGATGGIDADVEAGARGVRGQRQEDDAAAIPFNRQ